MVALLSFFLLSALAFGAWAFMSRQDYKDRSDQKSAVAVTKAEETQAAKLKLKFDEDYKNPNKVYQGSPTYGSVTFNYPKTWSAYVDETNLSTPINGYFNPNIVPAAQSQTAFALRVELVNLTYSQVMQQFSQQVKVGKAKAIAYIPPKMVGAPNLQPGTKIDGYLSSDSRTQPGSLVVIKVRDKTLKIYTMSNDFAADFNNTVLASLTFTP